ncbi:MAG: LytTR family transcriptional regulator [Bacteroidia bacterium]|nr:LytTR family transcriptional regulator [Bacteroidia bacterium]
MKSGFTRYLKTAKLSSELRYPLLFGIVSGFLFFYFLYFFEAYGIQKGLSYSGHSHLFRSVSFGVLILVFNSVCEAWIKPQWVRASYVLTAIWYLGLIFMGGQLVFLLFNYFWNWQEWNLQAYTTIVMEFALVMILPLMFYMVVKLFVPQRSDAHNYLIFRSTNGRDHLKIRLDDFMFASSSDNYVTVWYQVDTHAKQHLIRKPLKVLEYELKSNPEIVRSHRSYLVNRGNVQAVRQLRGKISLEINGVQVPVSKQHSQNFID